MCLDVICAQVLYIFLRGEPSIWSKASHEPLRKISSYDGDYTQDLFVCNDVFMEWYNYHMLIGSLCVVFQPRCDDGSISSQCQPLVTSVKPHTTTTGKLNGLSKACSWFLDILPSTVQTLQRCKEVARFIGYWLYISLGSIVLCSKILNEVIEMDRRCWGLKKPMIGLHLYWTSMWLI